MTKILRGITGSSYFTWRGLWHGEWTRKGRWHNLEKWIRLNNRSFAMTQRFVKRQRSLLSLKTRNQLPAIQTIVWVGQTAGPGSERTWPGRHLEKIKLTQAPSAFLTQSLSQKYSQLYKSTILSLKNTTPLLRLYAGSYLSTKVKGLLKKFIIDFNVRTQRTFHGWFTYLMRRSYFFSFGIFSEKQTTWPLSSSRARDQGQILLHIE